MKRELSDLLFSASAGVGVTVGEGAAVKLFAFMDELLRWNRKVNLTAITAHRDVVLKHLVDSVSVIPFLPERGRIVDLGSGGGFPAIVVGILRPDLQVVSVDSVQKKISFQNHVVRLLGLANVSPIHTRAEALGETSPESFDAAVSRAFAALPLFVRLAKPLVRKGGAIVGMKGKEGRAEAEAVQDVLADEGVAVNRIVEFELPVAGDSRTIVIMKRES